MACLDKAVLFGMHNMTFLNYSFASIAQIGSFNRKPWTNSLTNTSNLSFIQENNPKFEEIHNKMVELIRLRSQMISGNLPVDEMKNYKMKAALEIDTGNNLLGKFKSVYKMWSI